MAEETPQNRLAAAKKKLKEYWQRNSPAVPGEAKSNRKTNGSNPETSTSDGCHSPGDEQQKKQVEHQLEEEKKANNEKQKAKRQLEAQIQRLNIQKRKLTIDLYHTKRSLMYFEEESKDLAARLQRSSQCTGELQRALSAVAATQKKKKADRSATGIHGAGPTSSASLKDLEVGGSGWRCSDHAGQPSNLLLQQGLGAPLLAETAHTHPSPNDCSLYLSPNSGSTSSPLHAPQSPCQEQAVLLDWRSIKISRLNNSIKSLGHFPLCFGQVCTLKKEKQHDMHRVEKLERSLSQLKNQRSEPLHPEPLAVPSEVELQHLRKELERVSAELQAQVENHQHLSLLNQAQKERLRRQEERLQEQQERLRKQEERIQQLAVPQSGVEELNNENKSALHLEQQVEELQEKLREVETVTSTQKEPEAAVPAPGTGGESSGLMDLLEEKADLRERVEKLELRFVQYW
ncbi:PREDICTED: golgin subfamily A member 8C-like, partial [Mandrillus leucophaeus]|uniref:golgin subfamily A member 8C-like n=1 Tax=Mandrillus leucophaeus TaxID=9568 RepID=UPI0005F47387